MLRRLKLCPDRSHHLFLDLAAERGRSAAEDNLCDHVSWQARVIGLVESLDSGS